jgi:hypothetical protein
MKTFALIAFAAALPIAALAQSNYSFDDEVNAELNKMYEQSAAPASKSSAPSPQVQVNVQASQQASAAQTNTQGAATTATQSAPALQAQAPVAQAPAALVAPAPAIQKQPTTLVEASPLQESRAEQLRKARQDAEIQTEQKIVEKLETSRLEDEKRRSEALFGDKFNQLQNKEAAAPAPQTVPVVVPEQVVAPAPVKAELDKEAVRNEVRASLSEMKDEEAKKKPAAKTFFSGLVGMGDYPDVKNVRGKYSVGFSVGQKYNDHLLLEGSFIYSQFDVEQQFGGGYFWTGVGYEYFPRITEMNQYQGSAVLKYQILGGMLRPVFGGAAAYTYRTFTDSQLGYGGNDAQSHSVDVGLVTGADLEVSETFTIGLDIRYMWNLTSRTNNSGLQRSFSQTVYGSDTAIEKLNYMNIGVVGRATF